MALPAGITPKTVTIGIASFFDGTLADGTATITAPVNVVHLPTNRPIFSSVMSQKFVDGVAQFTLAPTDAPGLNRVDFSYKLSVTINGALVQPDPIYFTLPAAGPDTIDLDGLVTVPSSAGVPISVQAVTVTDINTPTSDTAVALRAVSDARYTTIQAGLRPTARITQPSQQMITTFAAGHTWAANGAGSTNLNFTADYVLGSQSVSLTSTGTGTGSANYAEVLNTAIPTFDGTAKAIRVWFRFPAGTANLSKLQVFAGESSGVGYFIDAYVPNTTTPLPDTDQKFDASTSTWADDGLWHSVTLDVSSSGQPSGSPTTKSALNTIRVRLTDNNGGPVTAYIGGVALVDRPANRWPNGVISFTFDDGYLSQYTAGRLALDRYGWGATAHVIQDLISTDGSSSTYLSLKNLHDLEAHNGWEIAAHSATNADHSQAGGLAALSAPALRANLEKHKQWLIANQFRGADLFAYPQGLFNATTLSVVKDYFTTARTTAFGWPETAPPPYPHRMRCLPIQFNSSLASLTALVDRVKAHRGWGQFYLHEVRAGVAAGQSTDPTTFAGLVDYVASVGVPVMTVGDVIAAGRDQTVSTGTVFSGGTP